VAGRLIVLDEGFPPELAGELSARGRAATTVAALGLAGAADAEVLAAVAGRGGVLVVLHDLRVRVPPAPVAHVPAAEEAARRDAVHRHAAAIAAQRRASARYV
jgi:hypothetical protein